MTLILALWSLVIILPLTLTVMSLGAVDAQISSNLYDSKQAEYLSESGVEFAMSALQAGDPPQGDYLLGGVGFAHVTATMVDANTILLTSGGVVNGANRTTRATAWRASAADPWLVKEWRQDG